MRTPKRVLSLILILLLISAALSGCGKKEPEITLTGVWIGDVDLGPMLAAQMDDSMAQSGMDLTVDSFGDYLDSLPYRLRLELKEDGTYLQTMDADSLAPMKDKLFESTMGYFHDLLREVLVITLKGFGEERDLSSDAALEAALGMSVDESIEFMIGTDLETFMHSMIDGMWDGAEDALKQEGKYKVERGKLFLSDSLEHDVDPEAYYPFTYHDGELTVEKPVGGDTDNEKNSIYPIIYHAA